MHEVSIMQEAVRMAVEAASASGATRVLALRLRVGQMSGAVPEAMQFAWEIVTPGTLAEGAALEIESVPATAWCARCRLDFDCTGIFTECPRCHEMSRELRRGGELEIVSVEIATPDAAADGRGTVAPPI
jgi:hydrogenase nickel incorporation protein HypA/HybF